MKTSPTQVIVSLKDRVNQSWTERSEAGADKSDIIINTTLRMDSETMKEESKQDVITQEPIF